MRICARAYISIHTRASVHIASLTVLLTQTNVHTRSTSKSTGTHFISPRSFTCDAPSYANATCEMPSSQTPRVLGEIDLRASLQCLFQCLVAGGPQFPCSPSLSGSIGLDGSVNAHPIRAFGDIFFTCACSSTAASSICCCASWCKHGAELSRLRLSMRILAKFDVEGKEHSKLLGRSQSPIHAA